VAMSMTVLSAWKRALFTLQTMQLQHLGLCTAACVSLPLPIGDERCGSTIAVPARVQTIVHEKTLMNEQEVYALDSFIPPAVL